MIPKTYDFKIQGSEIVCSLRIFLYLIYMLAPIYFHYEIGFQRYKIHNIGFDDILASKFVTSQTTVS